MIDWTKPICLDTVPPRMAVAGEFPDDDGDYFVQANWFGDAACGLYVYPNGEVIAIPKLPTVRNVRPGDFPDAEPADHGDDAPDFICNRAHYQALLARIADGDAVIAELVEALRPFARIADMEHRAQPASSVMVNVDRCRDARTALAKWEASK